MNAVNSMNHEIPGTLKSRHKGFKQHRDSRKLLAREYSKKNAGGRFEVFRNHEAQLLTKAMACVSDNDILEDGVNDSYAKNEELALKLGKVSGVKTYKKITYHPSEPKLISTCNEAQERLVDPKNNTESLMAKPQQDCSNPASVKVLLKSVGRRSIEIAFPSRTGDFKNELEWRSQLRPVKEMPVDKTTQVDELSNRRILQAVMFRK